LHQQNARLLQQNNWLHQQNVSLLRQNVWLHLQNAPVEVSI